MYNRLLHDTICNTVAANVMAVKDHTLQRASLKIEYMCHNQEEAGFDYNEIQDTLEVSNLPSDVSEDILELYFDNPRSGGCEGAVKAVSLIRQGVAKVQFSSAKSELPYNCIHACELLSTFQIFIKSLILCSC